MKFPCEIDNIKTLKKGMKITLAITDENTKEVMKNIYNFMDKSLICSLAINAKEEQKKLDSISPDQRKKIYAIIKDIAVSTGANKDYTKEELKKRFIQSAEYDMFSLSNCSNQLAKDFITYLIQFAFEYGIDLKEHPKNLIEDEVAYMRICLERGICAVCGRQGMSYQRQGLKLSLCQKHIQELERKGFKEFTELYHLKGV